MSVLGVWNAQGKKRSVEIAQRLLPRGHHVHAFDSAAVATDRDVRPSTTAIDIGEAPTNSHIEATADGLVLRRGAAWSAPVYYRIDDGQILASSHLTPLVRANDEIDLPALACRVGFVCHEGETRSVYRDIKLLRPFEEVRFGQAGFRSTVAGTPAIAPENGDPRELARELQRRIIAAVKRAAGDRKVALMLSGGLDSSTVLAALLAERGATDVHPLTIDFAGPHSDRPFVRALEDHFRIAVTRVRPEDGRNAVRSTLILDESPGHHAWDALGLLCALRAKELGADALLTGAGGDEVLGGDFAIAFGSRLKNGDVRAFRDAVRLALPFQAGVWFRLRAVAVPFVRPHLPRWVHAVRARRRVRSNAWAGPILVDELTRRIENNVQKPEAWTPEARYDALTRDPRLLPLAESWAQMQLLGGAPRKDPLYDDDVVRFAVAVPPEVHTLGGVCRSLHRQAMEGHLPDAIRRRVSKADFQDAAAAAVWPIDDLQPYMSFSHLGDAGIVNPRALQEFFRPLLERPSARDTAFLWLYFWGAVAAEAFLRQHA